MLKNKITLEASNINSGGGLVLLKLLLNELSNLDLKASIYLMYDHVIEDIASENYNNLTIIKTSMPKTFLRYFKKREDVVFLVNLPPFRKNKNSQVVFYNELFFLKKNLLSKSGIKFFIFKQWFKFFNKNVDKVLVQSEHIKNLIETQTSCRHVENIPIYKKFNKEKNRDQVFDFCYVSSAPPHKNHLKLFDALELLLEKGIKTNLVVTIQNNEGSEHLIQRIQEINNRFNDAIVNLGFIENSKIEDVYLKSKALIFPSISEAFGMPLIEAHDLGLKVLVSNLPYAFDVFEEVTTFDPTKKENIADIMERFLNGELKDTKQISKVVNKLDQYVNTLTQRK